jgi:hypothetical protein
MTRRAYSPGLGKWVEVESVEIPGVPPVESDRGRRRRDPQRANYGFVMIPNMWRQQLRKGKARGTTYHVAMVILDQSRWSEWVTLSNSVAGVDRRTKHAAIKQLREAGLIMVEERGRKSPHVKALFRG